MKKLRGLTDVVSEDDIAVFLSEVFPDDGHEIEFESFLRVQAIIIAKDDRPKLLRKYFCRMCLMLSMLCTCCRST